MRDRRCATPARWHNERGLIALPAMLAGVARRNFLEQFEAGSVPDLGKLDGRWAVHLLTRAAPPLRFFAQTKVVRSRDGRVEGHNEFLKALGTARFTIDVGPSALDPELRVARIRYDRADNPRMLRGLVDEVRQVHEGELIGRGVIANKGPVMWFSMLRL
jgi:hypothetical protein